MSDIAPGEVINDRDGVIQFTEEWLRNCVALMPELVEIDEMLELSRRGLVFSGSTARRAQEALLAVVSATGTEQLSHFFRLLGLLARAPGGERETVASQWLGQPNDPGARSAGESGISYIFQNLTGEIRLPTVAKLAYMSEPTFSKYFKSATGTTFSAMVKKLRVSQARLLLDSTDHTIAKIAELSGYQNISNFNRQFLAEVGLTPSAYRRTESSQKPPTVMFTFERRGSAGRIADSA